MSIYDSRTWISDLDNVINILDCLDSLAGKSILITGSTGLICSSIVDLLIRWNERHDDKIVIHAAGREEEKIKERFCPYYDQEWFHFAKFNALSDKPVFDFRVDYIIHGAGNASPYQISKEPVETMLCNFGGVQALLEYSKNQKVNRLLYISSSEIYGLMEENRPYKENDYGFLNILDPRNSYSSGKRAAETLCISYFYEYNISTVIARPGHIYGPTAKKSDNRVSSKWMFDAAQGENIVMKSNGSQIRSYCYCLDCAAAIMTILLKGDSAKAYNISNSSTVITIKELANVICKVANVELIMDIPDNNEKKAFNPMSNSSLNSTELERLGFRGIFDIEHGVRATIKVLKQLLPD